VEDTGDGEQDSKSGGGTFHGVLKESSNVGFCEELAMAALDKELVLTDLTHLPVVETR
jgi:hypothetical protein